MMSKRSIHSRVIAVSRLRSTSPSRLVFSLSEAKLRFSRKLKSRTMLPGRRLPGTSAIPSSPTRNLTAASAS